MDRHLLRQGQRQVARLTVALALGAATIPVALGVLAQPSAAATSAGSSTISAQQIVADAQCDIAWVEMDLNYLEASGPPKAPSCAPVPAGFQEVISNVVYDYCQFTLTLDGEHGFCIPLPTSPTDP
jgi:hypothetical protein